MTTPIVATPYGRDTSCTDRLYTERIVSGGRLLAEAAYRRLTTERGQLEDDLTYGRSLANMLNKEVTDEEMVSLPTEIRNELLKDERLDTVEVKLTRTEKFPLAYLVEIDGQGKDGSSFELVLNVADLDVSILRIEAA